MSADTKELELLVRRLEQAKESMVEVMGDILKEGAKAYIRVAKQHTPVDSGALRRSWAPESVRKIGSGRVVELTVINPLQYAEYVDKGHRQNVGQFVPGLGDDKGGRRLVSGWVEGYHMSDKGETAARKAVDKNAPKILNKALARIWEGK